MKKILIIITTGFEKTGITYHNNDWYYIDITTKKLTSIEKDVKKRKLNILMRMEIR